VSWDPNFQSTDQFNLDHKFGLTSLGLLNQSRKTHLFTPYQLARLDPKSIQTLVDIGGITVLLNGLGTDPERGLSTVDENMEILSSPI